MRPRNLAALTAAPYDVLVVGGGIHGLACAYEGASRGLRTALVEAGDFGGGVSFNHQKTAHGGLRALQSLSLGRAREAVQERRALARIAPWLLRPLPFVVGTYRSLTRSRAALRAAFAVDAWIGRDRNAGVDPALHLPRARLLSRAAVRARFPGVREHGLTGGAQWYDYQMTENDRLTFAFAAAADRAGADLASYAEAVAPLRTAGRLEGMRVRDLLTGSELDVRARFLINAAGAGAPGILSSLGVRRPWPLLSAMNLVTARPAGEVAAAAPDSHGRMLTRVPWRGGSIIGTAQTTEAVLPDGCTPTPEDVQQFLTEARYAFPDLDLREDEVTLVHHGLVPAVARHGRLDLLPASRILDHRTDGMPRALTIVGAKYTTARGTAEGAIAMAASRIDRRLDPSSTATTALPGAGIADHEGRALDIARQLPIDVTAAVVRHLTSRYAESAAAILDLLRDRPDLAAHVAPGNPAIQAEVVHAVRSEAAITLGDIVLRRTTIGAAGHPGADALAACAAVAAAELGWSPAQQQVEFDRVEAVYRRGR
jgi:glycerol-3-phosphate dehydrogenase